MSSRIIRDVMLSYERDRDRAVRLSDARRERVYEAVPRVREIDGRLAELGLSVSRRILESGGGDGLAEEFSRENERLNAEKRELMAAHGFAPEDSGESYVCADCKDTGFTSGGKCACFKRKLVDRYSQVSNLNRVLQKENFDNFNMDLYSAEVDPKTGTSPRSQMNKIWSHALNFVKNFDTEFTNLLFYGETGLGKTYLCHCIAKDLLDNGRVVIYVTSPRLFKLVESARFDKKDDDEETDEFLSMLLDADLLIIDDLGAEVSTIVTASELFNIINSRLLSRRATIISTNFSPKEIEDIYSDRITSRLFGNYTMLRFAGEDIRIKIRYKI